MIASHTNKKANIPMRTFEVYCISPNSVNELNKIDDWIFVHYSIER